MHAFFKTRPARIALALLLFGLGWLLIAAQQRHQWQRLTPAAVEPYVQDGIAAALPTPMPLAELQPLCRDTPPLWKRWWPARRNELLAECLADPARLAQGAAAQAAGRRYIGVVSAQVQAAQQWLRAYEAEAPGRHEHLVQALRTLQQQAPGLFGGLLPRSPDTAREPVGSAFSADASARRLGELAAAVRSQLQAQPASPALTPQAALKWGLLAAGKQLQLDYAEDPPRPHWSTARNSLADALAWRARAQGYAARGFSLHKLHALPAALMLSGALLLVAALAAGGPLLPWVVVPQLLGLGALMLTDLALTGSPAQRYLIDRGMLTLVGGDHAWPLLVTLPWSVRGEPLALWWPLLGAGAVLLLLRLVLRRQARKGQTRLLGLVQLWLHAGPRDRLSGWQSPVLLLAGCVLVIGLGMPAAVSELLIALACVGLATCFATQAAAANTGQRIDRLTLIVAAVALSVSIGGAGLRSDFGHAVLALGLGAVFFVLFGPALLRWLIAGLAAGGAALLAALIARGSVPEGLTQHLPPHVQERFMALVNPFAVEASDLARVRWLIASAGPTGWGAGYVPWQGLDPMRATDGLPLQGPSDYVLSLAVALWGTPAGVLLLGAVLLVFGWAATAGARMALAAGAPLPTRWLAALGAFGCMVMAAKALLSLGGVAGLLPLTGLPVALLGYGPVSHLAALLYLALALGSTCVPVPQAPVVQLHAKPASRGLVRRRHVALGTLGAVGLPLLLVASVLRLQGPGWAAQGEHQSELRLALARALEQAVTSAPAAAQPTGGGCPQLGHVERAWNAALARAEGGPGRRLDLPTLQTALSQGPVKLSCKRLAGALGNYLHAHGPAAPLQATGDHGAAAVTRAAVAPPRPWPHAEARDFATVNPWWGKAGCLASVSALPQERDANADACPTLAAAVLPEDPLLQGTLQAKARHATRQPVGQGQLNGHAVATGPVVGSALDPKLQPLAQRLALCYTARLPARDCTDVLPQDAAWRERQFGEGSLRAGALGLVLAEVESGRVVALASSVSDCTLDALTRPAEVERDGRAPALRAGSARCAQWPDRRSAYLLTQDPTTWMAPYGSALKPLAMVAGVDQGFIGPQDVPHWLRILAPSHDNASVQKMALQSGPRFVPALRALGFAQANTGPDTPELLWGGDAAEGAALDVAWHVPMRTGAARLRAPAIDWATVAEIRKQKEAGVNVDRARGPAVMQDYLAARALADASIGGSDMRVSALGLMDTWRRLALRAQGRRDMPASHLFERPGQPVPRVGLEFGSPQAAALAIDMTRGITASNVAGSAQGSCRVVLGRCAPEGLDGFVGKTGTADFLEGENSAYAKPGLNLPAKFFGGVFDAGPKRYAIGVMALRVREGAQRTLEFTSSAPAEAALTLVRQMRQAAP